MSTGTIPPDNTAPPTSSPTQAKMQSDLKSSGGGLLLKTPPRSSLKRSAPPSTLFKHNKNSRSFAVRHIVTDTTELWAAVETGDVQKVEQLVEKTGPGVFRDNTGCTLLHVAVENNQPEVVEWLLQLLSPNLVNKAGLTPVHLAAKKGHTEVLRILLNDPHLDPLARDTACNTYKNWLCVPLFEAVMQWDKSNVQDLVEVGADPDLDGGRVVGGALVKELGVTTARQLAAKLCRESILDLFSKKQLSNTPANVSISDLEKQREPIDKLPVGKLRLPMQPTSDVTSKGTNAYVTILSYTSFPGRKELHLPNSHTGAQNLASVFGEMGHRGHIHWDLTEQQTRQVMTEVRDMEQLATSVDCAIFVVAGHGTPDQQFLTSDGNLLDTQWMCNVFRDSQCLWLKNKPKLFFFDLCCGYYKPSGESSKLGQDTRVKEPLRDMMCLYSNSGELTWYSPSRDGTPFSRALCRTLNDHGHEELGDVYRHFITQYNSIMPLAMPQVRNYGFTKKVFISTSSSG